MLLAPAVMPVGDRRRDQYAQRLGLRGDGHWKMPDVLPIGHQHRRLVSLVGAGYLTWRTRFQLNIWLASNLPL